MKCDCFNGTILNGNREHILYSFALDKPPGQKIYKESRMNLFKKLKKSVFFSHIAFYLEDDEHKAVNSNGQTISFTGQLIKI